MRPTIRFRRGFTLVELLLFTGIMSVMAGAIVGFSATASGRFHNNVVRNSLSPSSAVGAQTSSDSGLEIDANTWCDLSSSNIRGNFNVHDNTGLPAPNAPASACDAEETRVLNEMAHLPGNPNPPTHETVSPSAPTGLRIIAP